MKDIMENWVYSNLFNCSCIRTIRKLGIYDNSDNTAIHFDILCAFLCFVDGKKSLNFLSQKFLMMFLVSQVHTFCALFRAFFLGGKQHLCYHYVCPSVHASIFSWTISHTEPKFSASLRLYLLKTIQIWLVSDDALWIKFKKWRICTQKKHLMRITS